MDTIYLLPGEERCVDFRDANGVPKVHYLSLIHIFKTWTVCLITVSGHGKAFDIAGLRVDGGIYRKEGFGVDSYDTTCSIHTMTSADHEY